MYATMPRFHNAPNLQQRRFGIAPEYVFSWDGTLIHLTGAFAARIGYNPQDMDKNSYDLIVIGAGPGGYVAAIRAAQLGMRVACVEKESALGGTCLNWGCIPSKALLDSSELFHEAKTSFAKHGIKVAEISLDLPAMMARKDSVVQTLNRGVASLFKKNKIEYVLGTGRFTSPTTVEVDSAAGKVTITAPNIIIATGSAPIELPSMKFDGKFFINSTDAIALPQVPKKLVVIGAGAIGLELGSVWSRLGSEVIVIEFMDRILPLTSQLQRSLEKQGLVFRLKTAAESAKVENGRVHLNWKSDTENGVEECDAVLVSVGRKPYSHGLGFETIGVKLDRKGFVVVDDQFRTGVPGVWAIGDVIGGMMLAHKAEDEGVACVELIAGKAGHVNYRAIPSVVYTFPELASVGMTEEEAAARGEIRVGKFPMAALGRARAMGAAEGLVKVIGDAKTDRLLGMHILSARASDIIAEGAVAIELASSVEDIARSTHAHPTMPEAIKEAAMAAEKRAIHL
jgi:dihydrolipoamide dehydrogenase